MGIGSRRCCKGLGLGGLDEGLDGGDADGVDGVDCDGQ